MKFRGYLPSNFPFFEKMIAQFCFFAVSHMIVRQEQCLSKADCTLLWAGYFYLCHLFKRHPQPGMVGMLITIPTTEAAEGRSIPRGGHCRHLGRNSSLLSRTLPSLAGHLASGARPLASSWNTCPKVGGLQSTPRGEQFLPNRNWGKFQG